MRELFDDIVEDYEQTAWTTLCQDHAEELEIDEDRLSKCSIGTLCGVKGCIQGSEYYYDFTEEELR